MEDKRRGLKGRGEEKEGRSLGGKGDSEMTGSFLRYKEGK